MKVNEIMSTDVKCSSPAASLDQIAMMMREGVRGSIRSLTWKTDPWHGGRS